MATFGEFFSPSQSTGTAVTDGTQTGNGDVEQRKQGWSAILDKFSQPEYQQALLQFAADITRPRESSESSFGVGMQALSNFTPNVQRAQAQQTASQQAAEMYPLQKDNLQSQTELNRARAQTTGKSTAKPTDKELLAQAYFKTRPDINTIEEARIAVANEVTKEEFVADYIKANSIFPDVKKRALQAWKDYEFIQQELGKQGEETTAPPPIPNLPASEEPGFFGRLFGGPSKEDIALVMQKWPNATPEQAERIASDEEIMAELVRGN